MHWKTIFHFELPIFVLSAFWQNNNTLKLVPMKTFTWRCAAKKKLCIFPDPILDFPNRPTGGFNGI
jgi:hypothetical protein